MWGAIIQLALGLGTAGYNAYKKKQAQNKLDNLAKNDYQTPQEYYDILGLAQSEAQTGYSPETLQSIQDQYNQNLTSSNQAILQGGGGINDISKNYSVYTDSVAKLGVADDTLSNAKMQNLYQATATIAGQKALEWKLNKYDRERNERIAGAMAVQGYGQGVNKGLNQAVQGGTNLFSYLQTDTVEGEIRKQQKQAEREEKRAQKQADKEARTGQQDISVLYEFGNPELPDENYYV
jgi:hypothetical protein